MARLIITKPPAVVKNGRHESENSRGVPRRPQHHHHHGGNKLRLFTSAAPLLAVLLALLVVLSTMPVSAVAHSLPDGGATATATLSRSSRQIFAQANNDGIVTSPPPTAGAGVGVIGTGSGSSLSPDQVGTTSTTTTSPEAPVAPAAAGTGCVASQKSTADEWVCNAPVTDDNVAEGTVCHKACPIGTVGETLTSTCQGGAWSLHAELQCAHNSSCPYSQRLDSNGWVCSERLVNGSYPEFTACMLPCMGDVAISSVCRNGAWSQYPFPACSGDMACPADARIFGWACNSTSALELYAHTTMCTSPCPNGDGEVTAYCNNGNWAETSTCPPPTPTPAAPAGPKLCPDSGEALCRPLDAGTKECGQFYAYNTTMLTRDPTGTTSACANIVLVDGGLTALGDNVWAGLSSLTALDITSGFRGNGTHRFAGLENLLSLTITAIGLTSLPPTGFAEMQKLTWLDLGSNQLTFAPDDAFAGLANLKLLNLAYNKLQSIENTPFKPLTSLQMLNLEYNEMTAISTTTFHGLGNMTYLDLKNNQIVVGPTSVGVFAGLPLQILLLAKSGISCSWAMDPQGGGAPATAFCAEA